MRKISQSWSHIQANLFPLVEEVLGPLTPAQREFIALLDLIEVDQYLPPRNELGRPPEDRAALARAFIAKSFFQFGTTDFLIDQLKSIPTLRRLCGWEYSGEVPHKSCFSRAFNKFAVLELPQRVHVGLMMKYQSDRLVGHLSRDSTDIPAREKLVPKPKAVVSGDPKGKRGRRRSGSECSAKAPKLLELQPSMSLPEMIAVLPRASNWGVKRKGRGSYYWWGYKCHVDWADGELPVSYLVTSASLHDSQAAIPLAAMSAERVENLYDLMDSAYDAEAIRSYSRLLGHVPIIDLQRRRGEKRELPPAEKRRFCERTTAERGFSLLKERFGGRNIRVRGHLKVLAHLGFCLLTLAADRLWNLLL